jgi:superfamily II DNA/RNA helicase
MALRIQYMYENSAGVNGLSSIFSAGDFTQMLNAATDISQLESYDRKMLKNYVDSCKRVEDKKAEAEAQKKEIERVSEESENKKAEIQKLCSETQQQVEEYASSIDSEEGEAARLIASIHAQQADIEGLERKAADEVAAADAAAAQARQNAAPAQAPAVQAAPQESTEYTPEPAPAAPQAEVQAVPQPSGGAGVLSRSAGRINGPSGEETYYNMDMSGVVQIMRSMGNNDEYWVRADGVKMLGNYVMVAANLSVRPRGSLVPTSLGTGIVCDTGGFAAANPTQLDIATAW